MEIPDHPYKPVEPALLEELTNALLRGDMREFNRLRGKVPIDATPVFSGIDLSRVANVGFSGMNLNDCLFFETRFNNSRVQNVKFDGSSFYGCSFERAGLDGTSFRRCKFLGHSKTAVCVTSFVHANGSSVNFSYAEFLRVNLRGAQLTSCRFDRAKFVEVFGVNNSTDLTGSSFRNAQFEQRSGQDLALKARLTEEQRAQCLIEIQGIGPELPASPSPPPSTTATGETPMSETKSSPSLLDTLKNNAQEGVFRAGVAGFVKAIRAGSVEFLDRVLPLERATREKVIAALESEAGNAVFMALLSQGLTFAPLQHIPGLSPKQRAFLQDRVARELGVQSMQKTGELFIALVTSSGVLKQALSAFKSFPIDDAPEEPSRLGQPAQTITDFTTPQVAMPASFNPFADDQQKS